VRIYVKDWLHDGLTFAGGEPNYTYIPNVTAENAAYRSIVSSGYDLGIVNWWRDGTNKRAMIVYAGTIYFYPIDLTHELGHYACIDSESSTHWRIMYSGTAFYEEWEGLCTVSPCEAVLFLGGFDFATWDGVESHLPTCP
jgi:hypothetical protein